MTSLNQSKNLDKNTENDLKPSKAGNKTTYEKIRGGTERRERR